MTPFNLLVLGSLAARPFPDLYTCSIYLHCGNSKVLVDCGEGILTRLPANALYNKGLDAICITHMHGDHVFGLPGLLTSMTLGGRTRSLTLLGPTQLPVFLEQVLSSCSAHLSFELEFRTLPTEAAAEPILRLAKLEIRSLPLIHRIPSFGFCISTTLEGRRLRPGAVDRYAIPFTKIQALRSGTDLELPDGQKIPNHELTLDPHPVRSVAYLTDTEPLNAWPPDWPRPTILLHDATFAEEDIGLARKTSHSTVREAAAFAKTCGTDSLLLTHRSIRYPHPETLLEQAQQVFAKAEWAQQGMQVQL